MKKAIQCLLTIVGLLFCTTTMMAQMTISGQVSDKNGPLPGVSVVIKGTTTGSQTDGDGKYSFVAPKGATTLVFSSVGYTSQEVAVPASGTLNVTLAESENVLGEVVISTGSRNTQRTVTDTPLPLDILSAGDLKATGQTSFDQALQYRVPSFNTVNTPVNDATTLLDPYEIRNMGPSRTLILINGKRKNLSSLLYVQFSPGRGETGVDLSAVPQAAIKRVEILRDGASAQYGSDAIAGVMNVILKDKYDYSSVVISSGITGKGDGGKYGVALNSGSNLGGKGYLNYTMDFSHSNSAVRSTNIDLNSELATFGDGVGVSSPQNDLIKTYLAKYPTGNNINGSGDITAAKFLVNTGIKLSDNAEVYANAALVVKKVGSFANFRQPYWKQDRGLLHSTADNGGVNFITAATVHNPNDNAAMYQGYIGYVPTFEGDLSDYNFTVGAKHEVDGWKSDLSLTTGGNKQTYTVDNTVNFSLDKASPTRFKPGGFGFNHVVGNIDISKSLNDKISIAFGAEARNETYTIIAGDTASYSGGGSNSFPGINSINAGSNSRFNIGAYADLSYDVTKDFLINGTVRSEKYSDFGSANVWKLSSRYKFADDKVTLRGSISTGFRAPTLHQIYAQSIQASFSGGTIALAGLFNNKSVQARSLGIPSLRPEKSTNATVGIGLNLTKNFSITFDYFNIDVKDRIVYSSSIASSSTTSTLGKILAQGGVKNISFFINGIETRTAGLDFVASYRNILLGEGKMSVNLAGNAMLQNEIIGTPNTPAAIAADGSTILNSQVKSLLTESRPKYKAILGFDYMLKKWVFNLNNTLFGPTAFRDIDNGGSIMDNIKAVFKPAVVTDLSIGYQFNKKVSLTVNCNNILSVLPKWDLEFNAIEPSKDVAKETAAKALLADPTQKSLLRGFLGFSGRYDILGYNGSQFSQLGRVFNAQLTVNF